MGVPCNGILEPDPGPSSKISWLEKASLGTTTLFHSCKGLVRVSPSMAKFAEDFVPDLRRLKSWPSMEDSPWRQPYLADVMYGELHRLVDEFVIGQGLKVFDFGCGTGFLSLELAREGHHVLGLDSDEDAVNIAVRTMNSDPFASERGPLKYECADFTSWDGPDGSFDLVVISRTLHHIPKPEKVLHKVHKLLAETGRLVCIDFAYDQFDQRTATWLCYMQRALEQAGWYKPPSKLPSDTTAATHHIVEEWFSKYEKKEKFNRLEEMQRPLYKLFREVHFSWKPYLYWEIIQHMRVPSDQVELEMARTISSMERTLVETQQIKPVLFCFVGSKA